MQKISLGIVPAVIFGITESVLVQRKPVITFFRKREPVMTAEIAAFVHMAGIPLALGTAC
ncbi:MAG: hypothetical protein MR436_03780 [Eubacterium sp.]|nr:hypothetical protein [Eubacterium sp.]